MGKFTRQQRLLTTHDFNKVFQASKKLSINGIILLYINNQLGYSRLGLAISKKYIAKAVKRNNVKRVIRETFRKNANNLNRFDVVVLVRSKLEQSPKELYKVLDNLWQRLAEVHEIG